MTALRKRKLEREVKLPQKSDHVVAAKVREDVEKDNLAIRDGALAKSCVECTNLRWDRNEMVSRTQQAEVDIDEGLQVVLTTSAAACTQMYSTVQKKHENGFRQMRLELDLVAKQTTAELRVASNCENVDVNSDAEQCVVVLKNQLKKDKQASFTTEACRGT